jgi:hypothetical protein
MSNFNQIKPDQTMGMIGEVIPTTDLKASYKEMPIDGNLTTNSVIRILSKG